MAYGKNVVDIPVQYQHLEYKALDSLIEFMLENEAVQQYIETLIETSGIEVSGIATETEMEAYLQLQANFQTKFLAKAIGIL